MDVLGSIGGRGSVEHAEAVKDFYVLLMNLRFSGLDELVGIFCLLRCSIIIKTTRVTIINRDA